MSTDRMLELLTEQTERPLSAGERAELETLLAQNPKWRASDFELAAAATALSFLGHVEPMPDTLKERIMADLETEIFAGDTVAVPAHRPPPHQPPPQHPSPSPTPRPRSTTKAVPPPTPARRPTRLTQYGGWFAAAAAIILLAIVIGWPKPKPPEPDSPSAVRSALLAKSTAVRAAWTNTEDPLSPATSGDVVFDAQTQTGVMRFAGLAPNDPTTHQYQLWIFDGTRSDAHPVDGGVFDVTADGEVLVRIDPKIKVHEPTMFAVTLERPGGVVVSTRERLVVLAKIDS